MKKLSIQTIILLAIIGVSICAYFFYGDFQPGGVFYKETGSNNSNNSGTQGIMPYKSGIKGVVTIGPTCPVERIPPDPNCADRPYQATLIIKNGAGHIVINSQTKSDGSFEFSLPPGHYTIENGGKAMMPTLRPVEAEVGPNTYTEVNLTYDSGIR